METIIAAPTSCEVRAVIRFLHAGQSATEIHRLCRVCYDSWENGAENTGMGALMCMTRVVKDDTQLWLNSFKKSTNACVENVVSRYQNFLKNFHKFRGLLCIELLLTDWFTVNCARWVPKLTNVNRTQRMGSALTFVQRCEEGASLTKSWLVTRLGYTSWMQTKQQSEQWMHTHSPKPKKFSVKKMMATVFWDIKGILTIHGTKDHNSVSGLLWNAE